MRPRPAENGEHQRDHRVCVGVAGTTDARLRRRQLSSLENTLRQTWTLVRAPAPTTHSKPYFFQLGHTLNCLNCDLCHTHTLNCVSGRQQTSAL